MTTIIQWQKQASITATTLDKILRTFPVDAKFTQLILYYLVGKYAYSYSGLLE